MRAREPGAAARSKRPEPHSDRSVAEAVCRRVHCPVLVICGTEDRCQPPDRSRRVAELTDRDLVVIDAAGHLPTGRDPVIVNLEIDRFLSRRYRTR